MHCVWLHLFQSQKETGCSVNHDINVSLDQTKDFSSSSFFFHRCLCFLSVFVQLLTNWSSQTCSKERCFVEQLCDIMVCAVTVWDDDRPLRDSYRLLLPLVLLPSLFSAHLLTFLHGYCIFPHPRSLCFTSMFFMSRFCAWIQFFHWK